MPTGDGPAFWIVVSVAGAWNGTEAVYPRTEVQLCIVHLVRASLNYLPWKLRKQAAADLQLIYRAATVACLLYTSRCV